MGVTHHHQKDIAVWMERPKRQRVLQDLELALSPTDPVANPEFFSFVACVGVVRESEEGSGHAMETTILLLKYKLSKLG